MHLNRVSMAALMILSLSTIFSAQASATDYSLCQNYLRQSVGALSYLTLDNNGRFYTTGSSSSKCKPATLRSMPITSSSYQQLCYKANAYNFFTIQTSGHVIEIDIRSSSEAKPKDILPYIKYRFEIIGNRCVVRDLHMAQDDARGGVRESLVFSSMLCAELSCVRERVGRHTVEEFKRIFLKPQYTGNSRLNTTTVAFASTAVQDTDLFKKYTPQQVDPIRFNVYGGSLSIYDRAELVGAFCRTPSIKGGFGVQDDLNAYMDDLCPVK